MIAPVKSKSHQELPLRVALYDDLLCGHGTNVLSASRWVVVLLDTLIRRMFQRLWFPMVEEEKDKGNR